LKVFNVLNVFKDFKDKGDDANAPKAHNIGNPVQAERSAARCVTKPRNVKKACLDRSKQACVSFKKNVFKKTRTRTRRKAEKINLRFSLSLSLSLT
jgi:hypothetical protein